MKKITAYFENTEPIVLIDSDDSEVEEYSKRLSEVFHSESVNIIATDHGCMIVKSNKLTSMVVEDESDPTAPEDSIDELKEDVEIVPVTVEKEEDETEIQAVVE